MAVHPTTDTIAAIATAPGVGGIGIIRISGRQAQDILDQIFTPAKKHDIVESHKLYHGTVVDSSGQVLDEVLAVYMRAPATYTREDVVEIHCHGSYLVQQSILSEVFRLGARPSEPGEFTKRAFLAGRIDLTRAEAVVDLLTAKTQGAVHLAVNQLQGVLFQELDNVRNNLVELLAVLEVAIDFPDDDVEILDSEKLLHLLHHGVFLPIKQLLSLAAQGKIIREGVKVVIAGRPNVGKSSLLNALLREERALVTSQPGTTRDTIEEMIAIGGIPIHLVDTAGIRAHDDIIEEMGIERARRKMEEADLVLFLIDASSGQTQRDREIFSTIADKPHLVILNKQDVAAKEAVAQLQQEFDDTVVVAISAREQLGLDDLEKAIYRSILGEGQDERGECAPNIRHRAVLEKTLDAVLSLERALQAGAPADLLAVEVQAALDYLGDIVGLTTPEDVLDKIFAEFCIGK